MQQAPWTDWMQTLAELGPVFVALVAFIVASYLGKIRYAREFRSLEEINARLTAVVDKNTQTTADAVRATNEAVAALKVAMDLLDQQPPRRRA